MIKKEAKAEQSNISGNIKIGGIDLRSVSGKPIAASIVDFASPKKIKEGGKGNRATLARCMRDDVSPLGNNEEFVYGARNSTRAIVTRVSGR